MTGPAIRPREPWFESAWFEQEIAERGLPDDVAALARRLHDDGFAVIRGVADAGLVAEVRDEVVESLAGRDRVQDAWRWSDAARRLATLPAVLDVLRALYGRRPVPFQTLHFEFGTQQRAHSDVVHFSSIPPRFMCGVWVALEDVDAGNGPLFYHPGSHRLPDPWFQRFGLDAGLDRYPAYEDAQEALLGAHGLAPVEFHASAGDALIWSANLVHGGMPISEPGRSRWSQVTHYFFEDCVYVTPLLSDPPLGEWYVRDGLVDIATGAPAPMSLDGEPVHLEPIGDGRVRIHRGAAPAQPGEALDAEVRRLSDEVVALRAAVEARSEEVHSLRGSHTWRVGHAVLAPARWARRLVRR